MTKQDVQKYIDRHLTREESRLLLKAQPGDIVRIGGMQFRVSGPGKAK